MAEVVCGGLDYGVTFFVGDNECTAIVTTPHKTTVNSINAIR